MTFASQSGIILTSRPAIISTQPYAKVSLSLRGDKIRVMAAITAGYQVE